MPYPFSLTPEDKAERTQAIIDKYPAPSIERLKSIEDAIWHIATKHQILMFNSVPPKSPFGISYAFPQYPTGYVQNGTYAGDFKYASCAATFNKPEFNFYKTNSENSLVSATCSLFYNPITLKPTTGYYNIVSKYDFAFWIELIVGSDPINYNGSLYQLVQLRESEKIRLANLTNELNFIKTIPVVDFGFRCYKGNQVIYDSSSVTWNQVDFFEVPANGTVDRYYPFCNGRTMIGYQTFIDPPPIDRKMLAHTIYVNGGYLTVTGGNSRAHITVLVQ